MLQVEHLRQIVTCCAAPFYAMSNVARNSGSSDKYERVGPDYFGYYSSEVVNILSQDEDVLPVGNRTSEPPQNKYGEGRKKNLVNHSDSYSGPLFSNGVESGLSDFKKERLRSLLRQSVTTLSSEVDEVVEPVFATSHLRSRLRSKTCSLNHKATAPDDLVQNPRKKQKMPASSSPVRFHAQTSDGNPQCSNKVSDDIQFLLANDSVEVEEMVKKHSGELSGTLGYMEQQLELLLDTVVSKCRSMTLVEKQLLQKSIKKLPARNLDRVAEIICRNRPVEEQNCDNIFVDLEKEDNATLWRLYYYVEAVEKANSLSCSSEAKFSK